MIQGAVLGSPISHSLSPVLHNSAFDFLGIEGSYRAIDVPSGALSHFLLTDGEQFDYLSLTMPLKEEILSLGYPTDGKTAEIRSGNTLYRRDEQFNLTSTDGTGLLSALAHVGCITFKRVLVLGAGATSRAVVGALDSVAEEIHVHGRSSLRQEALERVVHGSRFSYRPWSSAFDFADYDLVVNTTPAGAADLLADDISSSITGILFDVIYKPWPTELAKRWSDKGGRVINGLELLLYQGIDQLEIAVNMKLDRSTLAPHLRQALLQAAE